MTAARIALLRGVNVGGKAMVSMPALRDMAAELGLAQPRTVLNSGNLVFQSGRPAAELEALLERETARRLGVATSYFVRTAAEWRQAIAANPFPEAARDDPGRLLALFLKAAPTTETIAALQGAIKGREQVQAVGRQAYVIFPDGVGRSKLTPAVIEAKLGKVATTGRNWNTVLKLAGLAGD